MRVPTSLPLRWILAALAFAAAAVSAQDGPTLYASQDPRIAELRQGVDNGSQASQRIERAFVGDWIYRHEIAQANVGFRWTLLRIQAEGTLVMEYRANGTDSVQTLAGSFEFIHKGTDQHLPGKRPAVLVTVEPAALDLVIPLVELTVGYDARVLVTQGMVLKFFDLEGNEFVFLKRLPILPVLTNPALSNGSFRLSVATAPAQTYVLEYTDSLVATNWTAMPPVAGDGAVKVLTDPAASVPQRFYRLRVD